MIYSMYWSAMEGNMRSGVSSWWGEYLSPLYNNPKNRANIDPDAFVIAKYAKKRPNFMQMLADFIHKSEDCSFVYVITKEQEESFLTFLKEYKLIDLVVYQMPDFITNANHPTMGRRIKLYVLCSPTHFWRDMYGEDGQVENLNGN